MTLIAVLIALLLDQQLRNVDRWRRWDWVPGVADWIGMNLPEHPIWRGRAGLMLYLFPLVIGVWLIQGLLPPALALIFAVAVLTFCLGPLGMSRPPAAADEEAGIAGGGALDPLTPGDLAAGSGPAIAAHDRLFGVLFWFALLGPAGAVLFRLTAEVRRAAMADGPLAEWELRRPARLLYTILAWVPVRLVILSYGLAGDFSALWRAWRDERIEATSAPEPMLQAAQGAALGHAAGETLSDAEETAYRMVRRALWIWVFTLAAVTLGWVLGV